MVKLRSSAALAAFALASVLASPVLAEDSKDPIKFTLHDWTGQHVSATIMGEVLKKAGLNIEYVQADYLAQFAGLKTGDVHVAMEIWETTGREALNEAEATKQVENVGESGMQAIEEWWYPLYMKEKCPGLPDWEALKSCAKAFSTAETAPKGRYVGGPVTWGGFDDERVAALGLPFEVVHAGTDAALFAELESAYQREAPVLLWIYAPHWAPIKYKGEWVKFPAYEPACYTDPAWGINKEAAYDCAKPRGPIWKVVWSGLKDKWPTAHKAIKGFNVSNDEMGAMVGAIDLDGKKLEDVVAAWMAANEKRWKSWISG